MIILKIDNELVRVESWSDVEERAGFTKDLDPTKHELKEIIGRYQFAEHIPCGLSSCHTRHGKGYVVATKDGRSTNIGKDCGKSYFGVDFETLSATFDRSVTDKENRDRLWTFAFGLDDLKENVRGMRGGERGADWVFRMTRPLLEYGKGVPPAIQRYVGNMVKTRNPIVTIDREATEEEVTRWEGQRGQRIQRPHYVRESVASIGGLEALFPENDLRQILVLDVEDEISKFEKVAIDNMTSAELRRWSRWVGGLDAALERAASAIQAGGQLLRAGNLRPLAELAANREDEQVFEQYLKQVQD